jgi:hypothetical protein
MPSALRVCLCVALLFYGIGRLAPEMCGRVDARPAQLESGEAMIQAGTADPATSAKPYEDRDGLDLYGNEVHEAVAEYTLDEDGSLYEIHAPRTDAARLPPPTS